VLGTLLKSTLNVGKEVNIIHGMTTCVGEKPIMLIQGLWVLKRFLGSTLICKHVKTTHGMTTIKKKSIMVM
jgi:hypothetical protein